MGFIKTLWADKIYQNLYEDPQLKTLFNRSLEILVRKGGNKITIPKIAANAAVKRTDNLTVGAGLPLPIKDIDKDAADFDIYEYSTDPIVIRNIDVIQSNENLLKDNTDEIAQMFKEHILQSVADHIIRNVAAANKSPWKSNAFSKEDLAEMEVLLDNAKILSNNRFAMMKSNDASSVLTEDGMAAYFAQQQAALTAGKLPELFGFGFTKTTLIPKTKADGTIDDAVPENNVKRNVLGWRKQHMHLVIQTDIEVVGSERAEYLGGVYAFTTRYGVKLERSEAAVQKTEQ